MNDDITVKKDRILEASRKSPQAKEILETIFPEVFESEIKKGAPLILFQKGNIYRSMYPRWVGKDLLILRDLMNSSYRLCSLEDGSIYSDTETDMMNYIQDKDNGWKYIGNLKDLFPCLEELKKKAFKY